MADETLRESLTAALDDVGSAAPTVVSNTSETPTAASLEQPEQTKAERARDEQGRFAPKAQEQAETPAVAPEVTRKPRPKSWRKEFDADWERIDPKIADYIHEREEQYTNGVTTYKQEWDRAKPLLDVFAPYQQKLQQYGARPEQILPALFNAHLGLVEGSPQQRAAILQQLAREYGVQWGAELPQQAAPAMDPNTQWLMQRFQQTEQSVQQLQQTLQERENALLQSEIQQFASQTDKYPFFEDAKELMAQLLEGGQADSLDKAYQRAIRLDDSLWEREQARKSQAATAQQAQATQAVTAKAKAAAVSPKTASPTGVAAKASDGNLRSALSDALDSVAGGRF